MIKESREARFCVINLNAKMMILGAFATSIDALAVGVTFSFNETNIFFNAAVIGVVCFILCVIASFLGKKMGEILEDKAMKFGGILLILIGVKILLSDIFGW